MQIFKRLRMWIIIIVFAAALLLLFGGKFFFVHQYLQEPLIDRLENIQEVNDVSIQKEKIRQQEYQKITLSLKKVPNLKKTYLEIFKEIEKVYDPSQVNIVLRDNPSPLLEEAWYKVHFTIYEALAKKNYTDLNATLQVMLADINYKIWVDNERIYVQLFHGKHYIYRVLE